MVFRRSPNLVALSGLTVNGCFIEIAMSSFCLFHGHYQGLGLPVACLASHLLVTMCEYYDFLAQKKKKNKKKKKKKKKNEK
jgi:hypothetical protein